MGARLALVTPTVGEPPIWSALRNSFLALAKPLKGACVAIDAGRRTHIIQWAWPYKRDTHYTYDLVHHGTSIVRASEDGLVNVLARLALVNSDAGEPSASTLHRMRSVLRYGGWRIERTTWHSVRVQRRLLYSHGRRGFPSYVLVGPNDEMLPLHWSDSVFIHAPYVPPPVDPLVHFVLESETHVPSQVHP